MENLEARQLLAAEIDPSLFAAVEPRNVGTVPSFQVVETEINPGENDSIQNAEFVPLGTGPGDEHTIDLSGTMSVTTSSQGNTTADVDTFAFDLEAGDILDVAVVGATAN